MRRFTPLLFIFLVSCATSFHDPGLREVDAAIERAIAEKRMPGAVLRVERLGEVYERAYGNRALSPHVEVMTRETIFDAASVTKAVATAPSIWLLIAEGKIELDASARSYLPEISSHAITIRHLLTHSSGLAAGLSGTGEWRGYEEGIRRAAAEVPRNASGLVYRYSDINFILLGEIVRRVSGEPLDRFAARRIFEPLGMHDTSFRPVGQSAASRQLLRIAPTEGGLRGVVHDPTARRMGGVAGHAGVFTTAADLAKFARAVLERRMFPSAMTENLSPRAVEVARAGGFDLGSPLSRPRGESFSERSFGHTGWTGVFFWIDPEAEAFYILMSNRVHPDGRGSVVALQRELGTLVAQSFRGLLLEPAAPLVRYAAGGGDAQNGIDVLDALRYEPLQGKRIGLITNQSGIDRTGNSTIALLRSAPGVRLVALFSPEHGIRGTEDDENLPDEIDPISGLTIYSLYGARRQPALQQLKSLDALVFDVQDIGTRFYTYISTMGRSMEAAAEAGIEFIVLDRVNPIGGEIVEGPMLEGETIFTAWHPMPIRHGMTVGELAGLFRDERRMDLNLTIVRIRGWKREQWQDEAGLPWVNPSPNMRSLTAAGLYPGIGILERALSVGRGTETPFEVLGAPYIDGAALVSELGDLPGVAFEPIRFTPAASTHAGESCGGIRITITDRRALRAVDLGIAIASALVRLYPSEFPVDEIQPLLRHTPTLEAVRAGKPLAEIRRLWIVPEEWAGRRTHLLYE
jgi:uncharacterized protein YbbC (DUF1343 family)